VPTCCFTEGLGKRNVQDKAEKTAAGGESETTQEGQWQENNQIKQTRCYHLKQKRHGDLNVTMPYHKQENHQLSTY
jgi:hypothetical protein